MSARTRENLQALFCTFGLLATLILTNIAVSCI